MVDISSDIGIRLRSLQTQKGQTKTTRPAGSQDPRMSRNGSIFAGMTGQVSTTAAVRSNQDGNSAEVSKSTSSAKSALSSAKSGEASGTSAMSSFTSEANTYYQDAGDASDTANSTKKTLDKAQKTLNKDLTKYNKSMETQKKVQEQNAETISQNEGQMAELQSRLQNALASRNALGTNAGFMGDGTSDINAISTELEALGASNSQLQTSVTTSANQVKSSYKTMTKSSKNLQKQATKMNKVTTNAIAVNSRAQTATLDGTKKAQKLTVSGQITTTTGTGLEGTGLVMMSNTATLAAGKVLMFCGIGVSTSGGVMTAVGTAGQSTGSNTSTSLVSAAASLNSASKSAGNANKTATTVTKNVNNIEKNVDKIVDSNIESINNFDGQIDATRTQFAQVSGAKSKDNDEQSNGTFGMAQDPSGTVMASYAQVSGHYGAMQNADNSNALQPNSVNNLKKNKLG